jgi:hypothetical protein
MAQTPAANATAEAPANATGAPPMANATAAAPEGNATQAQAEAPAANATQAVSPSPAENAKASAAGTPAKPAKQDKAPAKPAVAKPAKAPADTASAKAKAPSGPLNLERAQEEFASFAHQWLAKLSRNMLGGPAHIAVTQEGGGYVARFAEVDQSTMEMEVKATDTPASPFVGILKYIECSYESRGDSPEAAKGGTFAPVRKVRFTELFRHSGKCWE